jgi:large subunit ribosomal protein L6
MSRVGKKNIKLDSTVEVRQENETIRVKGPNGEITFKIHPEFEINIQDGFVRVEPNVEDPRGRLKALHGLYGSLLNNAIKGVTKGFRKKLLLIGVGYKAQMQGKKLVLALGYSHPVEYIIPDGLTVACLDQTTIEISGIRNDQVGQFAAEVREARPPEPYKGKGIRYEGEVIKLKAGKTGKK